jgi:hypothetical protein
MGTPKSTSFFLCPSKVAGIPFPDYFLSNSQNNSRNILRPNLEQSIYNCSCTLLNRKLVQNWRDKDKFGKWRHKLEWRLGVDIQTYFGPDTTLEKVREF